MNTERIEKMFNKMSPTLFKVSGIIIILSFFIFSVYAVSKIMFMQKIERQVEMVDKLKHENNYRLIEINRLRAEIDSLQKENEKSMKKIDSIDNVVLSKSSVISNMENEMRTKKINYDKNLTDVELELRTNIKNYEN